MLTTMVVWLLLFSPSPSIAQETFVDTPESFQQAILDAQPGSTIIIRDGTYTDWGTFTVTSSQDAVIDRLLTIKGESEGGVIFQGRAALTLIVRSKYLMLSDLVFDSYAGQFGAFGEGATGLDGILIFDGAQDVIIERLTFRDIHGGGVPIHIMEYLSDRETRRITFQDILVDGYTQTDRSAFVYIYGGLSRGTPREIVVRDSVFKDRRCATTIQYCYWLQFGDGADSLTYDSGLVLDGNTFQDDTLIANGQDVLHIQGTAVTITDNHFERVGAVHLRDGSGHVIARNTFLDPRTLRQDAALVIHGADHQIVSNAFRSTSHARTALILGKGTVDSGGGGAGPDYVAFQDSLIAHNSFSDFRDASITMAMDSVGHYDGLTTVFPSGIEFHNNLVVQSVGTMFIGDDCTSEFTSISHNGRSGAATAGCMSQGTNNTTTDPQWKPNSVTPIYGSPVINAGLALPSYVSTNIDLLGNRRDSSPDIGAVEWGGYAVPDETETPEAACNRLFGETQNYVLCEATAAECTFNVVLAGSNCDDLCATQGKACVGAFETPGLSCAQTPGGTDDCSTVRDEDEICICESDDPSVAPAPRDVTIRYVDSSCAEQGDGTTTTCGANGPWNSLDYAMNVVKCIGMVPDDVLLVKGNVAASADGNWYAGVFGQPNTVSPDPGCAGIVIQNIDDEHVVLDGTLDITASQWILIGNDTYECQGPNCGTREGFPFAAWVGIAGTEYRLDLIQSQRACVDTLAAGKMTYNPASRRVCVHLPDDSDPSAADYVRITYYASAFDMRSQTVGGMIFRTNPGGGSFTVTRYRDRLFDMDANVNSDITIDGLDLSWAMDRAISVDGDVGGMGGFNFINNRIHHIGIDGISWVKDSAFSIISNNEIHDIGLAPVFELCDGVGDGCLPGYANPPNAIRVNNCAEDQLTMRSVISNNEIYNVGSGFSGISYGIHLQNCSYFNLIHANLIYDSTASVSGFRGIMLSGIPEGQYHDQNLITNTRCENADICLATSFAPWEDVEEFEQFADQTDRRNYFLGNTCYNPLTHCWLQELGGATTGEFIMQNNLAVIDTGYVLLLNATSPTFWVNEFRRNGFQCSHADCVDEVIADFAGVQYKRDGECTEGTDCISDIASGADNIYGSFGVQTGTMEIPVNSNAINVGQDLDDLPTDFLGSRRPLGLTTDIGAHEYAGFPTAVSLTQGGYQFYDRYTIDGASPISIENGAVNVHDRSEFTLRIGIYGNADSHKEKVHLTLYAQHCDPTCGAYEPVTIDCVNNPVCLMDNPTSLDGHPLSTRLRLDGRTFLQTSNYVDGEVNANRNGYLIGANEQLELEFSIAIGVVAVDDIINFRMYNGDGSVLDDYMETPSVTIATTFGTRDINRQ